MEEINKQENKAVVLADKLAPFLQPMPSSDESFIKTAAEFSLIISGAQNAALTRLEMLLHEPSVNDREKEKLRVKIALYERRKRYDNAQYFIQDIIASLSWRRFVQAGQVEGKVNKMSNT